MTKTKPYLVIHGMEVEFPSTAFRIKNFNLSLEKGELVVLLGESGSGKTTILNAIAGFDKLSNGQITLGEITITSLSPRERGIGMVFQGNSLFPNMNIFSNLEFGLKARNLPKEFRKSKILEVLERVKLTEKINSYPSELSSGQKQRVELARLLLREAPLWLLDEPLSNLDPPLKYELRDEIKRMHSKQNATTIYVTHSQSEALALADRVAIISNGSLIQVDTPAIINDKPLTSYVAQFIGEPGMNIFDAVLFPSINGAAIEIPQLHFNATLLNYRTVTKTDCKVGFRPEDIIFHDSNSTMPSILAKVISKELRGKRILAKVIVEQREFFIEGLRENLESSYVVSIAINLSCLNVFDSEGTRLEETPSNPT